MSAFPRVRAPGMWLALSQLDAAEMETFDAHQSKALNAEEGGTWAPSSRIILGGDGLELRALLAIGNGGGSDGTLEVRDGSTAQLDSGAAFDALSGSTTTLAGTTHFSGAGADSNGGAGHHIVNGGKLYVDDGAQLRVRSTGTVALYGSIAAYAGSTVNVYGDLSLLATSVVTQYAGGEMDLSGTNKLKTGGTFTAESGSTTTLAGSTILSGTLQTSGSGSITVKSGGSLVTEALATVSHAGDVDVSGTLTTSGDLLQTGPLKKSGSGAVTCLRYDDTLDSNGSVYDTSVDVWRFAVSADRTYIVKSTSPTPPEGATLRFVNKVPGPTGGNIALTREDSSSIVVIANPGIGVGDKVHFADLAFIGGSWVVVGGSGLGA